MFGGIAWLEWSEWKEHQESRGTIWKVFSLLLIAFIYNAAVYYFENIPNPNSVIISMFQPVQDWIQGCRS
ncbi:hypothetical protein J2TS4_39580 [Paenibacillus sp. J2TS4]|nr:hypothetical protein J2TS4_39580 [Paenibacillus sp. J2TS4]